jgi:hypothetical protein
MRAGIILEILSQLVKIISLPIEIQLLAQNIAEFFLGAWYAKLTDSKVVEEKKEKLKIAIGLVQNILVANFDGHISEVAPCQHQMHHYHQLHQHHYHQHQHHHRKHHRQQQQPATTTTTTQQQQQQQQQQQPQPQQLLLLVLLLLQLQLQSPNPSPHHHQHHHQHLNLTPTNTTPTNKQIDKSSVCAHSTDRLDEEDEASFAFDPGRAYSGFN